MHPEIHFARLTISSYLLCVALGAVAGALVMRHELARRGYPPGLWAVLAVVGVLGGLVGGKLYYICVAWDELFLDSARTYFSFTGTGWYGGIALGGLGAAAVLRLYRLPVLRGLDAIAPALPVGQALGRIGCFLAGCCRGRRADVPWGVAFPDAAPVRVHPAQIYEALGLACIAWILWRRRGWPTGDGGAFGLYLVLASLLRFLVEILRVNTRVFWSLTVPQLAATLGLGVGLLMLMRVQRRQTVAPASCVLLACLIGVPSMAAAADEVTLTGRDDKRTVPVEPGSVVAVELDATPGTGYSWTVVKNDSAVLKLLGPPRSVPKGDGGAPLGAGVKEVFRFSAEKKGSSTLELQYRRPWDRSSPPLKTFTIEAQVK